MLFLIGSFIIGFVVSFVNSIAGGGSVFSLPYFIFNGIPVAEAHGSNRFGLIPGNYASFLKLKTGGFAPEFSWKQLLPPLLLGVLAGTGVALAISPKIFNAALGLVFILLALAPPPGEDKKGDSARLATVPARNLFLLILVIGLYIGFLQVGTGLVVLYLLGKFTPLKFRQINALKSWMAFFGLLFSTAIFAWAGKINWSVAVVFSLGNALGGRAGAQFQIQGNFRWLRLTVKLMALAMAARLLFSAWSGL